MLSVSRLAIPVLLGFSLGANGLLGYYLWDTRSRFDSVQQSLDAKVAEAEAEVAAMTAAALAQAPDVGRVERRVDELEQTLFGLAGKPPVALDVLGRLERDVVTLDGDVRRANRETSALKLCVNNGFSTLQSNFGRVLSYVVDVLAGGIAVPPRTFVPRCY
jgi:hypothetical protein